MDSDDEPTKERAAASVPPVEPPRETPAAPATKGRKKSALDSDSEDEDDEVDSDEEPVKEKAAASVAPPAASPKEAAAPSARGKPARDSDSEDEDDEVDSDAEPTKTCLLYTSRRG